MNHQQSKGNRKNQEQNFTVKMTIEERQKTVHSLDIRGFSNQEIADQLKVSLSTVEKDLKECRKNIRDWFSQLGSEERYEALVDATINFDEVQKQLWKMTREEKDPKEKVKLLGKISDISLKKVGLFKNSEPYLTKFYFTQKDLSQKEIAREQLLDSMSF
jgi:IS30 family transposase